MHLRRATAALALCVSTGLSVACSDKTNEQLKSAGTQLASDASGAASAGGARGMAETYRGLVKTKANGQDLRSMTVLNDAKSGLPSSNVAVSGLNDANGDGKDDDGYVQFSLDNRSSCVQLPATGDNTEVTNEACPST